MLHIGVFFGGKSGEHEVSLVSGTAIMEGLDKSRYRVSAIGLRPDGSLASPEEARTMLQRPVPGVETPRIVLRNASSGRMLDIVAVDADGKERTFDLFFPVLHGTFGEDGTIQGLLEMAEIPYVGCGVLGSANGMDKETSKLLFRAAGLPIVPYLALRSWEWEKESASFIRRIAEELRYPCFVKPARLGSSVGIHKVHGPEELEEAVRDAFRFDYKILVERAVPSPREVECSVMGDVNLHASLPGEVVPSREFYDYRAKYQDASSLLRLPAEFPADQTERVRELATEAFRCIGGEGYARVDFLVDGTSGEVFVSEINTIPGFTPISMFPKLWTLNGMEMPALLDELVRLALERHHRQVGLRRMR